MPLKSRDPRPEVPELPFQLAILSICAVPEFHYDAFDNSVVGQKLKQRVDDRLIQWFTTYPYALATVFAFQMALGANVIAVFPDRKSTRLNSSHYCPPRMPSFTLK